MGKNFLRRKNVLSRKNVLKRFYVLNLASIPNLLGKFNNFKGKYSAKISEQYLAFAI